MDEEMMQREVEAMSINRLNELGNRAIQAGLIAGHGYYQGQYELLHQGNSVLLSPEEAENYLENLLHKAA
ncbi:hypothetical protein Q2T42_16480 [Leptolyngbya boryana CZ1]|uniref:Uncharacterized protein n=1 Tax=Leptolyngbya boryana CZ1 TaxID=3060204 RepID=A0AA96WNP6_LEPBY|nr:MULTISPECIES: hypothetical protein [Leptolyngbya]MBD1859848.1 hypothetical protein [Leptolyngbya sp. FACHB-1624]MBN8562720.1 hypothetical protein [Leptolyngbya sp. UWPOB_LEPTO1]WNZ43441.1 hypothetical protein Q2T42_16480 [Leptolyngbya boryana CZ1]